MNLLDWLLVALVLTYALSGYWQGFVTGACATAGLLLGGLTGVWLAPIALGDANPSVLVSLGALFIVILSRDARAGGVPVRRRPAARHGSSGSPSAPSTRSAAPRSAGVAVLLVAWALGVAIAGSGISGITPMVRESAILEKVDQALPSRRRRRAQGVQQRRRHDVLPALPRAVRPGADRAGRARTAAAAHATPTWSAPRVRSSRSRASTPAAAASRAPASSSRPTG